MSVVRRLRVVVEYDGLPRPVGQLSPREMHVERLRGARERAVETCVLPAVEGPERILLERVAVERAGAVRWVGAQGRAGRIRQHCCEGGRAMYGSPVLL